MLFCYSFHSAMSSPSNGASSSAVKEQEFRVRIPTRNSRKSFHIMKFNASLKVPSPAPEAAQMSFEQEMFLIFKMDPAKWPQVRMVREPNKKADKTAVDDEENPKFGAGSEFGREQREEARRRRRSPLDTERKPREEEDEGRRRESPRARGPPHHLASTFSQI